MFPTSHRARRPALGAALAIAVLAASPAAAVTNVFDYPRVFRQHQELVMRLQRSLRQHSPAEVETICRTGIALLPEDPTWRYNFACALATQRREPEALRALDEAVDLGFRDPAQIARDPDLAGLRGQAAFARLLEKARALQGQPVAGRRPLAAAVVTGGVALVSAGNTDWDFQTGCFRAYFRQPTNPPPPRPDPAAYAGPAAPLLRAWLQQGRAAGNTGTFYDNRDRGHSRLDVAAFPGLAAIAYDTEARSRDADYGLATFLFNGIVIGNSSLAITGEVNWRSIPRAALMDPPAVATLVAQYLNSHLYVYPEHRDHDADGAGDLFPVNQPYMLIAQGSSGSDQPFLQALAAALAALTPETRDYLAHRALLVPTLQMLLRTSQKTLSKPDDYFTGRAHPAAFDAAQLDVAGLVARAHALGTNDIPPLVALRTQQDHFARPGVDFFDAAASDALFDSPCAIARIMRGMAWRRTMTVEAALTPVAREGWRLRWVLLQGDSRKVTILPMNPDQTRVEIAVAYHGGHFPVEPGRPLQSSRVDIGVFATDGTRVSAPSFICFQHLDNEIRTYADDGRILSVDYAAATNRYVDPALSLRKNWRDEYDYDAARNLTGWRRIRKGQVERFNAAGERVEETDALGRPTVTCPVEYLPRSTARRATVPDLVPVDGAARIRYRYASDDDRTGTVAGRD